RRSAAADASNQTGTWLGHDGILAGARRPLVRVRRWAVVGAPDLARPGERCRREAADAGTSWRAELVARWALGVLHDVPRRSRCHVSTRTCWPEHLASLERRCEGTPCHPIRRTSRLVRP